MIQLQKLTGISEKELLYHLLAGLEMVEDNLQRYPEDVQIKEVSFTFSTKQETSTDGEISIFVGFEHSKTTEYSKVKTATYDFEKEGTVSYQPSLYEWKEIGLNLQFDFAGQIMRDIAASIIAARQSGRPLKNIDIEYSFAITKTDAGILGVKFFDGLLDVSASRKSAKKVINKVKISFAPKKDDAKPQVS